MKEILSDSMTSGQKDRYLAIQNKMSSALSRKGQSHKATLIAVSKKQPVEAIEALYRLGHRDFGENYAQELVEKAEELVRRGCLGIHWHFIGHLQTNKINSIIPYVSLIHTIDSEKLALKLAQKWLQAKRSEKCGIFIEVNLDEEKTKSGIPPQEVETLCKKISQIPELRILGLMGIPKPGSDSRLKFKKLSALEHLCRSYTEGMLSMGMSDDFETAIEEGATHIRVGTALFGPRHEN